MAEKKKWGKLGAPHSKERKEWMAHIRRAKHPAKRKTTHHKRK
jgi:hypothetical protein